MPDVVRVPFRGSGIFSVYGDDLRDHASLISIHPFEDLYMEMNAPITFEMKVYATNDDQSQNAILTMNMPRGRYLTPEAIQGFVAQAESELPEGYRLMTKSEFFNALLAQEYGASETFATPGSPDFIDEVITEDGENA